VPREFRTQGANVRVLIVDDNIRDTAALRLALEGAGHEVEHAAPSDPRLCETIQGSFDIVVLDSTPATVSLIEMMEELPAAPSALVCTAKSTPASIAAVFAAGAEDFMKKPYIREDLLGRVSRIGRTRAKVAAAMASLANIQTRTSTATRLAAWKQFNVLAAECLAGMTMLDLAQSEAPREWKGDFASSMPLTYTPDHLEFRVAIDGDHTALEAISTAALGVATPEAICDMLNEMANVAGGAFMRAALDESLVLTSGLPEASAPAALDGILGASHDIMTCWLSDSVSHACFRVRLSVRARMNVMVPVTSLREGMVLAKDILGKGGVLLLKAGTRVTSSTSERVRSQLDGRCTVEVADCAA
jgi:DNA-binding response OmpR family regulator